MHESQFNMQQNTDKLHALRLNLPQSICLTLLVQAPLLTVKALNKRLLCSFLLFKLEIEVTMFKKIMPGKNGEIRYNTLHNKFLHD